MIPFFDEEQQNIPDEQLINSTDKKDIGPDSLFIQEDDHFLLTDDNNILNIEHKTQSNIIPNSTEWKISSPCFFYFCCCCKKYFNRYIFCNEFISPCITVKGKYGDRTFWGFLELDLYGPLFALFLIIISHLTFFSTVMTFVKTAETTSFFYYILFVTLFLLIMFLWSFFSSACSDPGFLPFDFESHHPFTSPHQHQSEFIVVPKIGWRTQLSGLAVRPDQIEYAKSHSLSFASFSQSAGRFVVRADHICGWTGNWVGKRNHKQFILMSFWGSLMMINLFFWQFKYARMKTTDNDGSKKFKFLFSLGPIGFFVQFCAVLFEPIFVIIFVFEFVQSFINVVSNTTKIKNWKKRNQNTNRNEVNIEFGFMRSMREICGDSSIFCWIFPFPAFGDDMIVNNEEMIYDSPRILY